LHTIFGIGRWLVAPAQLDELLRKTNRRMRAG